MKAKTVLFRTISLLVAAGLGFGANSFHAQTAATKVGFVNTDAIFKVHPLNAGIEKIKASATAELTPLSKQITDLQTKGDKITAKEKQDLETAIKTAQPIQQKWRDQILKATEPMNASVNKALADIAAKQGFSIVMERSVAASSGLVVYADEANTDITDTVIKAVSAK